jgi:uncharacterized membrane protein (DUF485 family)
MSDAARNGTPAVDWTAIERMPEFRELVAGRRRFAWAAGAIGIGLGALYVILAATAPDVMGTALAGSFSVGFAGGVGLVLLTWAITLMYMRRSTRVWAPMEARIRRQVLAGETVERGAVAERFVREPDAAAPAAPAQGVVR